MSTSSGEARRVLDRHLLASPDSSDHNQAWRSFGWSRGLTREQAARLEDKVPWALSLARESDPPVLIHSTGQASAFDEMGEAFLRLDDRLGFCLSGMICEHGAGSNPRLATHTVFFNEQIFREIDGYPQGLHIQRGAGNGNRPADWFRAFQTRVPDRKEQLRGVNWSPSPHFREWRIRHVKRLACRLRDILGSERAKSLLVRAYCEVGHARAGGPGRLVVGSDRDPSLLSDVVRLIWLSLPLADRVRLNYASRLPYRRLAKPSLAFAGRVAIDRQEGGVSVIELDRPDQDAEPHNLDPIARRAIREWARLVVDRPDDYGRVASRYDIRGLSLYSAQSARYILQDTTKVLVDKIMLEAEAEVRERWRGLGRWAAREVIDGSLSAEDVMTCSVNDGPGKHKFLKGIVRSLLPPWANNQEATHLAGQGRETARLAIAAGTALRGEQDGWNVVRPGVQELVNSNAEGTEIGTALELVRKSYGHNRAIDLTCATVSFLKEAERLTALPSLLEALYGESTRIPPKIASTIVRCLADWSHRVVWNRATEQWRQVLPRIWQGIAEAPSTRGTPEPEQLIRFAWLEGVMFGTFTPLDVARDRGSAGAISAGILDQQSHLPWPLFVASRAGLSGERH